MSTQDKWTNEYNDKEFAEKLEKFAIKFEQSKYKNVNEHNIKDSQTREIAYQIKYCKYVIQRLDNHKKELKPLLAEAYEKYRPVLIETLEFWEGKKWFENVKNELEIDDKNIQDLKIHERLRKLAFKCDNEKENFKSYNTTALKINELEQQIELYEFVWFPLEKKKDKENPFLVDEFGKYEPVIIEALDYWESELQKLKSGKETQNNKTEQEQSNVEPPKAESPFSVMEWATIFYYANETKLLLENRYISNRMKEFMEKHEIRTTFNNFKTKYYEAVKRINTKNDYPINKLELIIPFLKENYKQTVTKVENDIIYLDENKPDY